MLSCWWSIEDRVMKGSHAAWKLPPPCCCGAAPEAAPPSQGIHLAFIWQARDHCWQQRTLAGHCRTADTLHCPAARTNRSSSTLLNP